MIEEIWKDVVGYEDMYQVSDLGNVRSLDQLVRVAPYSRGVTRYVKGRPLTLREDDGPATVSLSKDGSARVHQVYKLMLKAFHEELEVLQ